MNPGLTAPFPYYGGKRRWINDVWQRFRDPDVYIEPFAGSCAILLGRPEPCRREVVCDLNGFICNFWRAVRDDPDLVAHYADYPTVHQDLTARHRWLIQWGQEHRERLSEDPDWYDAKAAGWWAWGASLWIGHGWCHPAQGDGRPKIQPTSGGQGVSAQVIGGIDRRPNLLPSLSGAGVMGMGAKPCGRVGRIEEAEKRPRIFGKGKGGIGVARQRENVPRRDVIPRIGSEMGGQGTSSQRARAQRLVPWFRALAERLHAVIVLNRQWKSALTPTVLADTPSSPGFTRAIFLDPPYLLEDRRRRLYPTDADDPTSAAARDSWKWALDNGARRDYRIAYCCREGDFYFPETWDVVHQTMSGIKRPDRRHRLEAIYFSPSCGKIQGDLF